ncbi:hypothetical protein A2U01_0044411 [Trifolium medium]|uniref:Uncharacterized protein n=1 Tax=Trifolium medium TaxID=97028 RepID=A0A392QFR3_9FABA|nr:hypothetical protein [Trifolium medium]
MRCSLGWIASPAINSDVQFLHASCNKEISLSLIIQVSKVKPYPLIRGSSVLQFCKLIRGGHQLSWQKEKSVLSLNSAFMMERI